LKIIKAHDSNNKEAILAPLLRERIVILFIAVRGSDGGGCFVRAMFIGWDCFGCARADDVGWTID